MSVVSRKSAKAKKEGKFKHEIVPIKAKWAVPKTDKVMQVMVDHNHGTRDGVTKENGWVNYSCAAVHLTSRSVAKRFDLPIVGKFVTSPVIGVPPRVMGIGPAFAIPRVLQISHISPSVLISTRSTKPSRVKLSGLASTSRSQSGGGIALGHPLCATGVRQVATDLAMAKQTGGKVFVTSLCIGSGVGTAAVLVSEH
ncbi:hypothetical protein BKA70DRAFT_1223762 [Coprinopsis sp. MPI-PUGE-AT-0042]|nr:hypothetical protein BKA70DRAFT_1223762 [Coprinopsis sp. MPI-PUGE-AT-0042]